MKTLLVTLSYLGLILTAVPAFLSFYGFITFGQYEVFLILGAILWFGTAPFWIFKKNTISE